MVPILHTGCNVCDSMCLRQASVLVPGAPGYLVARSSATCSAMQSVLAEPMFSAMKAVSAFASDVCVCRHSQHGSMYGGRKVFLYVTSAHREVPL